MTEQVFSLLRFEVRIETNCRTVGLYLKDILPAARDEGPASASLRFQVLKEKDRYVVLSENEPVVACRDPEWTAVYLHQLINQRVCSSMPPHLMIHCGSGTMNGRKFLLCGEKGAGKTTLLCRLLHEGVAVHADEIVLLCGDRAIPFPRKFHVKENSLALLPQLKQAFHKMRLYPAFSGGRFYFFAPSDAGFDWDLPDGPADTIFYLEADRSRPSRIVACSKSAMVRKIMCQTFNFERNAGAQMRLLCRTVDAAQCYDVYMNNLEDAVEKLKKTFS